uniref:Uncharacterized protein n=1 Tax=Ananas comosus var. bracteatus TaxID=296719 RepID=A0A6V7Q1P7_ANACO|nr:unnamed protein product [Ananas comosus var. bracteatus]
MALALRLRRSFSLLKPRLLSPISTSSPQSRLPAPSPLSLVSKTLPLDPNPSPEPSPSTPRRISPIADPTMAAAAEEESKRGRSPPTRSSSRVVTTTTGSSPWSSLRIPSPLPRRWSRPTSKP